MRFFGFVLGFALGFVGWALAHQLCIFNGVFLYRWWAQALPTQRQHTFSTN